MTGAALCCQSGYANCGSCVNQQTDVNNCGSCSNKCGVNRTCEAGTCKCPGYAFPAACGGCGSWTFESGTELWAKDTDPSWLVGALANINGVQNLQWTQNPSKIHDGSGALAVSVLVDSSTTSIASVSVPFCQAGNTVNLAGFTVSFWVRFDGPAFDPLSDDVFLFVEAWSQSTSDRGPALFKNQMPVNTWIHATYNFPIGNSADHLAIDLRPGGQWQGTVYIDSVQITGL